MSHFLTTASGMRLEIPDRLHAASEICRRIERISNLSAVVPVWSDGSHINIITLEERGGRIESVYRGHADLVDGIWVLTTASEDVSDVFSDASLNCGLDLNG